jgi:hypothetical protein
MERWTVNDYSVESYREFLRLKQMPIHKVVGETIHFEDLSKVGPVAKNELDASLFDYERFIVSLALRKKRFAIFADVGLGKTLMFIEWVRHVSKLIYPKKVLVISQLHLIKQTIDEQIKFYRFTDMTDINACYGGDIERFLSVENNSIEGCPVGIVNVDKFRTAHRLQDDVGAVVLDESSILKSATGVMRTNIINSCKGIEYKLCCTATPAPNDRQEYANHALFLGYIDNYKQFFTRFFYNTGSGNDFMLKPHAKTAFYAFLATFSIFLKSPKRYGFNDNLHDLKPAQVIWDSIALTDEQRTMAQKFGSMGQMGCFGFNAGGMTNRNKLSQIAKGFVYDS